MKSLDDKLRMFSGWDEPYVWRLKLSAQEFECLRDRVVKALHDHQWNIDTAWSHDFAILLMVYIGEWYKRCYSSKQTTPPAFALFHIEYKKMWEASGFDLYKYVYRSDGGFRWQYSTYILGGLAARLETEKKDNRLLKNLCLLMHGEDIDMDSLADGSRAFALRQSIERQHSLYHYLEAILRHDSGDGYPFAQDDLADETSPVSRLLRKIQTANREAMRDKFRTEWLFTVAPHLKTVSRTLRLTMTREHGDYVKPELSRPYLSYQRLEGSPWDISSPEDHEEITLSVRWRKGNETVQDENFERPFVRFHNTHQKASGYLAFGKSEYMLIDVPAESVTRAEILVSVDGKPCTQPLLTATLDSCLQLWRTAPGSTEWTTKEKRKADTAVLYTHPWHPDGQPTDSVLYKPLAEDDNAPIFGFTRIFTDITLKTDDGRTQTFFNHTGHYLIESRSYDHDIAYHANHTVAHYFLDDEDVDDDPDISDYLQEDLSVLFGLQDLMVSHLRYDEHGQPMELETVKPLWIENLENGEPFEADTPTQKVALRIHIDDELSIDKTYYYVPVPEGRKPLERDLARHEIRTFDGQTVTDDYQQNHSDYSPTLPVTIGSSRDFVTLDVYRPQDIIEKRHNGEVIAYYPRTEHIDIPLLLCDHFSVRDFGVEGVRTYDCSEMKQAYTHDFDIINKANVKNSIFSQQKSMAQTCMKGILPDYLHLSLTKNTHRDDYVGYEWDVDGEPEMKWKREAVRDKFTGIFFEAIDEESSLSVEEPIFKNMNIFGLMGHPSVHDESRSRLDEFLTASRLNVYYFFFYSLRMIVEKNIYKERLLRPLMELRHSQLTAEDIAHLRRFAFEFKLNGYEIQGMLQDIKLSLKRI